MVGCTAERVGMQQHMLRASIKDLQGPGTNDLVVRQEVEEGWLSQCIPPTKSGWVLHLKSMVVEVVQHNQYAHM